VSPETPETPETPVTPVTPFRDLDEYVGIPRVTALRLSPDGSWLAAAVQTIAPDRKKYGTSIWRIDPGRDDVAPRRLTRSAEGEGSPRFLQDGSLLFVSKRPDPDNQPPKDGGQDENTPSLWLLPAGGGEARGIASLPGGVAGIAVAADAGAIAIASPVLPGAVGADEDAKLRKARKDAGVTAILHESVPVRYWDHDLGPAQLRLFAIRPGGEPGVPRDLTPEPGRALDEQSFEVTPDGAAVLTGWWLWDGAGESRSELVLIETATGDQRTLLASPGHDFDDPRVSPDGRFVACTRTTHDSHDRPHDVTLVLAPLTGAAGGPAGLQARDLLPGLDRWPVGTVWAPDSRSVYFTADDHGRRPVFRVDAATGEITRLTADHGAYTDLCPAPDGRFLYALRSAVDSPPAPVRLDATAAGQRPVALASPGGQPELPGRLREIETVADDGSQIRSWLVLPDSASADAPAALLLWVHGGPMMSWNSWSWRWNPWLMAARGYAVLLPDPALSTGYGHDFVARGYRQWGPRPFADLMAITDAAVARPDIDSGRTAMMGGSYGGYMANWIAGHTDRFKAIVSHASLWVLDQMFGTTDRPMFWRPQFGDPLTSPERYRENSPHRHVTSISTPMLVIHGNKDYRVPIGEALRLWWDLSRHGAQAKFLYFPDENHWILSPGHAALWYETVFAFLAHHVLGEPWRRPDLL